jgi:TrmH family RNA methyltransferase
LFENLPAMVELCRDILTPKPLAVVLTAYSIRASFFAIHALMRDTFAGMGGTVESGELVIREKAAARRCRPRCSRGGWPAIETAAVGQVKEVTSLANPLVKDIKALALKKFRDQQNAFMAEGLKLVIDALDLGWTINALVYRQVGQGQSGGREGRRAHRRCRRAVLEVSEKVLSAITRRDNPQMVVGVFEQRWKKPLKSVPKRGDVWVALDRVRDPGNLGTIIRTADAVGAKGVILVGDTTDPFSLETVRATMGSVFAVPVAKTSVGRRIPGLAQGVLRPVVGTHLKGAVDYRSVRLWAKAGAAADGQRAAGPAGRTRRKPATSSCASRRPAAPIRSIWRWRPA